MILCIPFLAVDWEQLDPAWITRGFGIEASLFDRRHALDDEAWARVRANVRRLARDYRPRSLTFHFPVNDCDYVHDSLVERRLLEAIELVDECGANGLVIHSNQVRSVGDWRDADVDRERAAFAAYARKLRERTRGAPFWVGLENMPITGNDARELDPLFVFPQDFDAVTGDNVGVTWDFCHYSYSVWVARLLRSGALPERGDYPVVRDDDYLAFGAIDDQIVHYHFSAFRGVARAAEGTVCTEGVAPWEGEVPEQVYAEALARMGQSKRARTVTLEIRERDYRHRENVLRVADWCQERLQRGSS